MDSDEGELNYHNYQEKAAEVCQKVIEIRKFLPDLIDDVEDFCTSDQLALEPLQEKIKIISTLSPFPMYQTQMLLNACSSKNITVEIVECILDVCGRAASHDNDEEVYPIHIAASNIDCPTSVIELLVEKNPSALEYLSLLDGWMMCDFGSIKNVKGLPLHFYLTRKALHIDVEVVKRFVYAYPEALTTLLPADNNDFITTLNALLYHEEIDDLVDVFRELVELNPATVQLRDSDGFTPLHTAAYCLKQINPMKEIIQVLLKAWPDGASQLDEDGNLPLHLLCSREYDIKDEGVVLDVIRLLIDAHLDSLRQINLHGHTPLHQAAVHGSPALCQLLVNYDSELVSLLTGSGKLPIHKACS